MSFEDFLRSAQQRAAEPQAESLADRLRAIRLGDERRSKIEALAEEGSTEGERVAARAALLRMDAEDAERVQDNAARLAQDLQDEDDFGDARAHGAA